MTIKLDITNLLSGAVGEHGLPADHMAGLDNRVQELRTRMLAEHAQGQHSYLKLAQSPTLLESVLRVTQQRLGRFRHLVLLGIGGSSLGIRTLVQALDPAAGTDLELHVVDNTDPALFAQIKSRIDLKDTLFVAVSKSGETIETVVALGYFAGELRKAGLSLKDHVIAVTDPEQGALRKFAGEHGLDTAEVPPEVGGRFSVLSAAGLVPATLMNVDAAALLEGAAMTAELCTNGNVADDWPARLGLLLSDLCLRGKTNLVFMPYSSRLGYLSAWFVQLWDESLGKDKTLGGEPTQTGQTTIPALGARDQHAQLQLFLEGPNDKVLLFVRIENHQPEITLGEFEWDTFNAGYVEGKTLGEIINAQHSGTAQACKERQRPNATLVLPRLNTQRLGEMLMGLQIATTYAGYALNVNPYDQPSVELGKRISRKMLGG